MSPKTSLIITSYHADEEMLNLTKACIESLKYGCPEEVILVDDCSPLEIGGELYAKFLQPNWHYIRREENGFFPKCANTGFAAAKGDVLILSNNDIIYTPGWLEAILKPIKEGYDISSIRMSDSDGYLTDDYISEGDRFGSLWAMTRKVYETIGGFDENFGKGTFEDLDFHKRAEAAGFKIGKNHAALVEHRGRATMDKLFPDRQDFYEGQEHYKDKYGKVE